MIDMQNMIGEGLEEGYELKLADGRSWVIICSEELDAWGEEVAGIMGLKRVCRNEDSSIIFVCSKIQFTIPSQVWQRMSWPLRIQIWANSVSGDILCEFGDPQMNEDWPYRIMEDFFHLVYYDILTRGGFTCHAALVELNGNGYILSGPSDIGKTTCCRRIPSPWVALCDDRVLVVRDKQKRYFAHPFPTWNDYILARGKPSWNSQYFIPVKGVFFLRHSIVKEHLRPIGAGEMAVLLQKTVMADILGRLLDHKRDIKDLRGKVIDVICQFLLQVPAFSFEVSLTGTFWKLIEDMIEAKNV